MNRKTGVTLADLPPSGRRRFLKLAAAALAGPGIPAALRYGVNDSNSGAAFAQEQAQPTFFVEINYRDQVDLGEVFVAPGLATATNLIRGETGKKCALFYQQSELIQKPGNFYLTPDSRVLEPHLDNIASIDLFELLYGENHYHQSANKTRLPDAERSMTAKNGKSPAWLKDPSANFPEGNEAYISAMATPASLHNYAQKQLTNGQRNGVAIKGLTRAIHTCYHFGGPLPGAELDRFRTKKDLFTAFPVAGTGMTASVPQILPTPEEAELFARLLNRVDPMFLERRRFSKAIVDGHAAQLKEARNMLYRAVAPTGPITLPLTPEEVSYWRSDVPEPNVEVVSGQEQPKQVEFQIWEQYAFATKLLVSGATRTVAIECEFIDVHDQRTRKQMQIHTKQLALPLARMIEQLKQAGMWDRTLIAIYTTDGSRSPAAGSAGDKGKNTVTLAGGMIRGGYFGDIRVFGREDAGHQYSYHAPDLITGAPASAGVVDNTKRLSGYSIYRTVAKALRIPDEVLTRWPEATATAPLPFMLQA